jgi:hypothetical protein
VEEAQAQQEAAQAQADLEETAAEWERGNARLSGDEQRHLEQQLKAALRRAKETDTYYFFPAAVQQCEITKALSDIDAAVTTMNAQPDVESVQEDGCRAIYQSLYRQEGDWDGSTLTIGNRKYFKEGEAQVLARGGVGLVIRAMQAHPSAWKVQVVGCEVLSALAHNSDTRTEIVAAGGIRVVLQVMARWRGLDGGGAYWRDEMEGQIVTVGEACAALLALCPCGENSEELTKAGGVKAVVQWMQEVLTHVSPDGYEFEVELKYLFGGCEVLCNLSAGGSVIRNEIVAAGGGVVMRHQKSVSSAPQGDAVLTIFDYRTARSPDVDKARDALLVLFGDTTAWSEYYNLLERERTRQESISHLGVAFPRRREDQNPVQPPPQESTGNQGPAQMALQHVRARRAALQEEQRLARVDFEEQQRVLMELQLKAEQELVEQMRGVGLQVSDDEEDDEEDDGGSNKKPRAAVSPRPGSGTKRTRDEDEAMGEGE